MHSFFFAERSASVYSLKNSVNTLQSHLVEFPKTNHFHSASITNFTDSLNNNINLSSNIEGETLVNKPEKSSQKDLSVEMTNDQKPADIDMNTKSNENLGSSNFNPHPIAVHSLDCMRTRLNGCIYSRDRYLMGHYM